MENIEDILRSPANPKTQAEKLAAHFAEQDEYAFGALSLGELLYDRISIDPSALDAFEFVKPSTADIYKLATWSHHIVDAPNSVFEGHLNQLQGYVFERIAAMSLRQSGAVVEFPSTTTNPGWDFLVNGEPVQAKCGLSPDLVTEHLSRYPDIPRVVVNEDLASHFPGNHFITPIHGITRDAVRATTEHSLDSAADMLDLHLAHLVPTILLARYGYNMWRGNTDWRTAPSSLAVDTVGRLIGVAGGHVIGGAVVAVGLTGWPAILIPVFASIGGLRGGRKLSNSIKRHLLVRAEFVALSQATMAWCAGAARVLDTMIIRAEKTAQRIASARSQATPDYVGLFDDWQLRFSAEQEFRRLHLHRFNRGAADPTAFDDGSGPLGACAAAMFAASSAGLLPADLNREFTALNETMTRYVSALRRFLLSP